MFGKNGGLRLSPPLPGYLGISTLCVDRELLPRSPFPGQVLRESDQRGEALARGAASVLGRLACVPRAGPALVAAAG